LIYNESLKLSKELTGRIRKQKLVHLTTRATLEKRRNFW